jgi:hypothetical protein
MQQHAIFLIAAGAIMALTVFVALRPHQTETTVGRPYGGLIADQCAATPDNGLIPVEYGCGRTASSLNP